MRQRFLSISLIIGTLWLLAVGCDTGNSITGGFVYNKIYVYEDGNLIDAQDFIIELPASGGMIEKEFLTYGIKELRNVKQADGLSAEFLSSYPPPEDEFYDVEQYLTRYKQKIRFKAEPNNGKKDREAKIMIVTDGYNGYAAIVSIRQPAL